MSTKTALALEPPTDLTLQELYTLQRFAELGRLGASLLHEISNPLTAALLELERVGEHNTPSTRLAYHNMKLLQSYVEAARQQLRLESETCRFSVRRQFGQVKRVLLPYAQRARVNLEIDLGGDYQLEGDPVKFQQIIANLISNAIDSYRPLSEQPHLPIRVRVLVEDSELLIEIRDHGIGMNTSELRQMFAPFYTTKVQKGYGLGIGLTIVKQYVEEDFGGSITAFSTPGRGSCFQVRLNSLVK